MRSLEEAEFRLVESLLAENKLPVEDIRHSAIHFLIRKEGDELVACGALERLDNCCLMRSVAVNSRFQKRGIAADMSHQLLVMAREQCFGDVYLLTTDAHGYFSRIGFVECDRALAPTAIKHSHQFSELCPDSAILMRYVGT